MNPVHFSSATCEWSTPEYVLKLVVRPDFNIVLDVCATPENAKAPAFYTLADDGLKQDWAARCHELGGAAWMNPPYGDPEFPCKKACKKKRCRPHDEKCKPTCTAHRGHCISVYVPGIIDWVKKAWDEAGRGATVVSLLPSRTDTAWYHDFVEPLRRGWAPGRVDFFRGRLKFGGAKNSAPFPSMLAVFLPR